MIPRVGTAMVDAVRRTKSSIKQLFIPGMLFGKYGPDLSWTGGRA